MLVAMAAPLVLRHAVDDLAANYAVLEELLPYAGLLIFIALVQGVFLFTQRRLLINMSRTSSTT